MHLGLFLLTIMECVGTLYYPYRHVIWQLALEVKMTTDTKYMYACGQYTW